jgi:predicted TIM-barrel fold metal-dependent hydrolase
VLICRGNFNTKLLKHVVDEIGYERVIFSIDYPYEEVADAVNWWNGVDPELVGGREAYEAMSRTNAIKLLKLKIQ